MDLKKTFEAEPMGLASFLTETKQGCYIPIFQRAYSWRQDNVTRLFEDAIDGLKRLADDSDSKSIRFLGTIIAIKQQATKVPVAAPMNRDLPAWVMTIIDGQQRLCTLIAVNILLHDRLRRLGAELEKAGVADETLMFVTDYLEELHTTFLFEPKGVPYPRIITAEHDQWGRKADHARYDSPIAGFIWQYHKHLQTDQSAQQPFTFAIPDPSTLGHEALKSVVEWIVEALQRVSQGAFEQSEVPDASHLIDSDMGNGDFWSNDVPEEVEILAAERPDEAEPLLRLMAFGRFLNTRMAVTIVTTDSDDYAFDIFEALNTTGQPLTAIETFKPKVTEAEKGSFKGSPSEKHLDQVETYLGQFDAADPRQRATSRLLIPFALMAEGRKLEAHLNEQRRFLRNTYDALLTIDRKREFTGAMGGTAKFLSDFWDAAEPILPNGKPLPDDELGFCRLALTALRHEVVIALLARYHIQAVADPSPANLNAFRDAVKAVTACSILWRAAQGTSGIDSMYRKVMAGGTGVPQAFSMGLVAGGAHPLPSIDTLRKTLSGLLRGKLGLNQKSNWIDEAVQQDLYKTNKTVAEFLLLAAHHLATPEPGGTGLIIADGRKDPNLMKRSMWRDPRHLSLEHVAPQSNSRGKWPKNIYDDRRLPDSIGNLVHMPELENQSLSDRDWNTKRALLRIFASTTKTEASQAIADAERQKLTISTTVRKIAEDGMRLPMCAPLQNFEGPWNSAFIRRRGERLLSLAWDQVAPWLGLPTS